MSSDGAVAVKSTSGAGPPCEQKATEDERGPNRTRGVWDPPYRSETTVNVSLLDFVNSGWANNLFSLSYRPSGTRLHCGEEPLARVSWACRPLRRHPSSQSTRILRAHLCRLLA